MKVAVVGCGRMGAQPSSRLKNDVPAGWLPISHIESFLEIVPANQMAICDSNKDTLDKWGVHYDISHRYGEYHKLIDDFKPKVISVATRTPEKRSIIEYACKRGVGGIYVEKPIANSLEQCRAMLTLAAEFGVNLSYGVNRRYHSVYRRARELILGGEIGEVVEINIEHGASQLFWTHPHSMDLILFLSGSTDISTAQARLARNSVDVRSLSLVDSDPIVESAHFTFASGMTANLTRARGLNVRVAGSEGNLVVHANGAFIELHRKDHPGSPYFLEQSVLNSIPLQGATVTALMEVVQATVNQAPVSITGREIETGMRMMMGCVWSHLNEGKPILISDVPSGLVVTGKYGDLYA